MTRRSVFALAVLVAALGSGLSVPACADKKKAEMAKDSPLWDLIERLQGSRPFHLEDVVRITGVALRRDAEVQNPFFAIYRSARQAEGAIAAVELRAPVQRQPGKGGMVAIDVNPRPCLSQKDVMERFGKSPELSPPSAHGPPDALVYLVYPRDWGDLRFGFSQKAGCLGAVVLDANVTRR